MVAAKLDQSRVLATKLRQNRLTLKGRSTGQRHTDSQTNSAENNGPSGLESGQQINSLNEKVRECRNGCKNLFSGILKVAAATLGLSLALGRASSPQQKPVSLFDCAGTHRVK